MVRMRRLVLVSAAVAVLAACSSPAGPAGNGAASDGGTGTGSASTSASTASAASTPSLVTSATAVPTASIAQHVSKLMVVVLENHSRSQALAQMPYLASQASRYGQATLWYAVAHPSLPNYVMLASGSTYGIRDDKLPAQHRLRGASVFGQLVAHGRSVRVYAEAQPSRCATTNTVRYAARHNPWTYFADAAERRACARYDLAAGTTSSGALHSAVAAGRLPTYSMLVPDLCHDAHDCRLSTADAWLKGWLTQIKAAPDFRSGRLAVVVTFDEDDRHAGNHVATVVLAAQLRHKVVNTRFTHASLAAAPSRLVGLPALRAGKGSPDVLRAFGLR